MNKVRLIALLAVLLLLFCGCGNNNGLYSGCGNNSCGYTNNGCGCDNNCCC